MKHRIIALGALARPRLKQASADLAREMSRAGNFSRLTESREQVFVIEAQAQLSRENPLGMPTTDKEHR